jgi:hypothetical protein
MSLAAFLGATQTKVASGVSVGIQPTIDDLLQVVADYRADGYVRIKLKIVTFIGPPIPLGCVSPNVATST